MKLTYLGQELNIDKEHEIITEKPFGFMVTVQYENKKRTQIFHNVTEVHHLYHMGIIEKSIAIESDIHETGVTRLIEDVALVSIKLDDKLHDEFSIN